MQVSVDLLMALHPLRLQSQKVAQPNTKCRFAVVFGTPPAGGVPTELKVHLSAECTVHNAQLLPRPFLLIAQEPS